MISDRLCAQLAAMQKSSNNRAMISQCRAAAEGEQWGWDQWDLWEWEEEEELGWGWGDQWVEDQDQGIPQVCLLMWGDQDQERLGQTEAGEAEENRDLTGGTALP